MAMAGLKRNRVDGQLSKEAYYNLEDDEEPGAFTKATPKTLSSRRIVTSRVVNKKKEFMRHIAALNSNFFEWFQRQYQEDKYADLSLGVQDYIDYVNQLQDRYLNEYGEVLTFGSGDCGQLAHGVVEDDDLMVKFPRIVYSLRDKRVCGISCGGIHNAVFTDDGLVYTWGCADDGSLGRPGEESTPLLVQGLADEVIIGVACGDGQTIAVSTKGEVFGWGAYKDKEGKKWFNPSPDAAIPHQDISKQQNEPIRILGLSGVVEIACGSVCNLARCDDGRVFSWGLGECGELGREVAPLRSNGKYNNAEMLRQHLTPGPMYTGPGMPEIRGVKSIGCGSYHCFVIVVSDSEQNNSAPHAGVCVLSCGLNNYGQLGLGMKELDNKHFLTEVTALRDLGVIKVGGGSHHSLALTCSGAVYAFGRGDSGQLGVRSMQNNAAGDYSVTPIKVDIPAGISIKSIACGANHNLAIASNNDVYSWGYGEMLALGHGKERDELLPRKLNFEQSKIDFRIKVNQVAGGGQHSAIIGSVITTM